MNEADAADLVRNTLWMIILLGGPFVVATMVVGSAIAVLQALTQVQEATLTFVPKIVAVVLVLIVGSSFLASHFRMFGTGLFERIQYGFGD